MGYFPIAPHSGASHDHKRTLGAFLRYAARVRVSPERHQRAGPPRVRAPAGPPSARPQPPGTQSQRHARDERCLR